MQGSVTLKHICDYDPFYLHTVSNERGNFMIYFINLKIAPVPLQR